MSISSELDFIYFLNELTLADIIIKYWMVSTRDVLTRGDRKYAAKKAHKDNSTESVSYDPSKRKEYLEGFHKRKVARREAAKKRAEEIARQERIEQRKLAREAEHENLDAQVKEYERAEKFIKGDSSPQEKLDNSDSEFEGFKDSSGILKKRFADGSDVTVEELNVDPYVDMTRAEQVLKESTEKAQNYASYVDSVERSSTPPRQTTQKAQKKHKKFRYLPKLERKMLAKKNKVR